jgi:hypothetical protein
MNHFDVLLTLESDVSVPATGATLSGRPSLHHLPGASLRGAMAARLYGPDEDAAFVTFHTHAVQFGNAYPAWFDGRHWHAALPWPLTFKKPKVTKAGDPAFHNSAAVELTEQHSVVREPHWLLMKPGGQAARWSVRTSGGLRTTISPSGKASDGLLFQMDAITSGQTFVARIYAESAATLAQLRAEFDGTVLTIGRSRSAEYGRVRCEVLAEPVHGWTGGSTGEETDPLHTVPKFLSIYLASDTALVDALGMPQLAPTAAAFGLDGTQWTWNAARSELDVRSWSPWVSVWRRPDVARHVLTAGSVVTFERVQGGAQPDAAALRTWRDRVQSAGVGAWRNEGLGRVLVAPAWLSKEALPGVEALEEATTDTVPPESIAKAPFMRWADEAHAAASMHAEVMDYVMAFADGRIGQQIVKERLISNSQWGQLRYAAQQALRQGKPAQFIGAFQKVAAKGVSGLKWKQRLRGTTIIEQLTDSLETIDDLGMRCRAAVELATEMTLRNSVRHQSDAQNAAAPQQGADA